MTVRPAGSRPTADRTRGSASILLLGIGLCLILVAAAISGGLLAVEARHRAQIGADAAALAGAMRAVEGRDVACARATELARVNGTTLTACRLSGLDLTVRVSAPVPDVLSRWGCALAAARAGPAEEDAVPVGVDRPNRG